MIRSTHAQMSIPTQSLTDLLASMFTVDELRRLLSQRPETALLLRELPGDPTASHQFIHELDRALTRRGLINEALFEVLALERPHRSAEIEATRRSRLGPAPTSARRRGKHLPQRPPYHVPREALLQQLHGGLRSAPISVIALHALDGFGKTTALAELCHHLRRTLDPRGAVLFYSAPEGRGTFDLEQILTDLAIAQGAAPPPGIQADGESPATILGAKLDALTDALQPFSEVWILIDDLERQLDSVGAITSPELTALFRALPARLRELAEPRPLLRILAASAIRPDLPGDPAPLMIELDAMTRDEARVLLDLVSDQSVLKRTDDATRQLLLDRTHRVPGALVTLSNLARDERRSYAELLAAPQLSAAGPPSIESWLHGIVELALSRVNADTRALLNAAAIFPGPVAAPVLHAAAGLDPAGLADALAEADACHLLHRHDGAYQLPGFLRAPLRETLSEAASAALHRRAADAVILGLEDDPDAWRDRAAAAPFLARLDHLIAAGDRDRAFTELTKHQLEGFSRLGLYEPCIELRRRLADLYGDQPHRRASNLRSCATLLTYLGRYAEAQDLLDEATPLSEGDDKERCLCLNARGILAYNQRRIPEARRYYELSLEIAEQHELEANLIATRRTNLAEVFTILGDFDLAKEHAQRALAIYEGQPDAPPLPWKRRYTGNIGAAWADLAKVYLALNELRRAVYYIDLAVDLARGEGHQRRIGMRLIVRGQIALAECRLDDARRSFENALDAYSAIKSLIGRGRAHLHLGLVYHHKRDRELAREHYQKALHINHSESNFAAHTYLGLLELDRPAARESVKYHIELAIGLCERRIEEGQGYHDVLYTRALARLLYALLDGDRAAEGHALSAYDAARRTCSAAGICRRAVVATLNLLPDPTRQHGLVCSVRGLLDPAQP
jgi:tetratricopeptide (TPR) repeat protein